MFEGEEDNLAVLYGPTTDGVRMVLLSSIVACVVLCVVGSIMHAVLVSVCFVPVQNASSMVLLFVLLQEVILTVLYGTVYNHVWQSAGKTCVIPRLLLNCMALSIAYVISVLHTHTLSSL